MTATMWTEPGCGWTVLDLTLHLDRKFRDRPTYCYVKAARKHLERMPEDARTNLEVGWIDRILDVRDLRRIAACETLAEYEEEGNEGTEEE